MSSILRSVYRYYIEALVDEAVIKKRSIVDLTNFDIEEIPEGLFKIHLQKVFLNKNKIIIVSPKIQQWNTLTVLSLDYNRITRLPTELKELKGLIYLNVSHNPLDAIPSEIGELESLEILWCNSVGIDCLPEEICKLTNLRTLGARKNNIMHLPKEFWKLSNLNWLTLENNKFEEWPSSLNALDLVHINMSQNHIKDLPTDIIQYKSLIYLFINHNEISSLPFMTCDSWDLSKMESLIYIDLHSNPIIDNSDFKTYVENHTRLKYKDGFVMITDESEEDIQPQPDSTDETTPPSAQEEPAAQPENNDENQDNAGNESDSSLDDWEHSITSSQLNFDEIDNPDENEISDYDIAVISKFVGTGS